MASATTKHAEKVDFGRESYATEWHSNRESSVPLHGASIDTVRQYLPTSPTSSTSGEGGEEQEEVCAKVNPSPACSGRPLLSLLLIPSPVLGNNFFPS